MVWAAQHLDFLVFGLVILLGVPFVLLKAFKWHKLLCVAVPGASYRIALRSFLLGMTVSLFTPGRLGELARVACFPGNRTSVLMLALVDKLVDVTVLMTLCALSLWTYSTTLGIASITGTALLVVGLWTGPQWLKRWRPVHHVWTLLHAVPCHLRALHVGLTVCCYVVMALQFHLLLSCMRSVPLWVSSSVLPPILLGSAMPVFINGLGGREGIATILLSHYAVPGENAVIATFLLFVVSGLLPGGAGIVPGLKIFMRNQKKSRPQA